MAGGAMSSEAQQRSDSRLPMEIAGVTVTPHVRAKSMRYGADPGEAVGALVRIFVRHTGFQPPREGAANRLNPSEVLFDGQYPIRYLLDGAWSWHDNPNVWRGEDTEIPPGGVSVWTFNTVRKDWGVGRRFTMTVEDWRHGARAQFPLEIAAPKVWLSAVTFLASDGGVYPDRMILHVANESKTTQRIVGARLYLPEDPKRWRILSPQPPLTDLQPFPADGIPAGDRGGAQVKTGRLPLTYCALEVTLHDPQGKPSALWAHLRIKREAFDISGGWVGGAAKDGRSAVLHEPYLKTLTRLHVNTAHLGLTPGYTDQTGPDGLYTRYPLKFFGGLEPLELYDTDENLPRIHAAERLGEPQLAFSSDQRLPQEVWRELLRYAPTRIASTVTLNDESNWRYWAGLSDYPHYDSYRVTAPSVDNFRLYDRWNGIRIGWGAPLETIGDKCRALREMSRPAPTAYWSQGPASGWDVYDGRLRTAPTPDEIRLQAYHALASRITSLYWFNLSLTALVRFRDTLEELERIGREMRMLEEFYLEGDAYRYRQTRREGRLDWDLASIAAPQGALLFALDLDYAPDPKEKVFRFGAPREARFAFDLPAYLRRPADLFRIDADGVHEAAWRTTASGVEITDRQSRVAIYVATHDRQLRARLERRRQELIAQENALRFDPARSDADFERLKAIARPRD
jgi:hypothetical protein